MANWSNDDLEKIWHYRYGNSNSGYCPKVGCQFPNILLTKSNYGNHSNTSWVVDHILAKDNGGKNYLDNLQPMHNLCNSIKSNNPY